jgi:hypothetical protein
MEAKFNKDRIEVPAVLSGYKIDVLVELEEELPADARVTILYNGKPTAADKVAVTGTEIWLSDLVLGGEPADFVSGDVATWTVLISGNGDDVTVKGTIKSIVSSDGFDKERVVLAEAGFEFEAKDSVAPELVSVDPEKDATVELAHNESFVWKIKALDKNLYELEVDHNIADLPEFSVYASAENPYGTDEDKAAFEQYGVEVTYNAAEQKWTIDFGEEVTERFVEAGGVTFYLVLKDEAGNQWGSMYDVTDENTFVYHISQLPAPDTTPPVLVEVTPPEGDVVLAHDETFVWTVQASDENLYELEVDHNIADLPEFSVYASEEDPYGGQGSAFAEAGVTVTYDADAQKWTIDFGKAVTDKIVEKGGITFYLVIKDEAGNQWGSMYDVTDENTFVYHISQLPAPEPSTYKFSYEVPADVVAGREVVVPVTFATEELGDIWLRRRQIQVCRRRT